MNVKLNISQCNKFAKNLKDLDLAYDNFENPHLFPPHDVDKKEVANFFFFMVAIDHRTHPKEGPFEGYIDREFYHGADLLYTLARKKQFENPKLFTPEYLQNLTVSEVKQWFSVQNPSSRVIRAPKSRVVLLRDCAKKLLKLYDGDANNIVKKSQGYLKKRNDIDKGLLDLLKEFKAYEDPLNKKSFLLIKFLERRSLLKIKDPENIQVPVDNILTRVSLRAGAFDVLDKDLEIRLKKNLPLNKQEEYEIRKATLECYKKISSNLSFSPLFLDDILWEFGRCSCKKDEPLCNNQINEEICKAARLLKNKKADYCIFREGCKGGTLFDEYRLLKEPNYKTWYY